MLLRLQYWYIFDIDTVVRFFHECLVAMFSVNVYLVENGLNDGAVLEGDGF